MRIYESFFHTDFFRFAFLISNIVRNKTLYTASALLAFPSYIRVCTYPVYMLYVCVMTVEVYESPQMYALHVTNAMKAEVSDTNCNRFFPESFHSFKYEVERVYVACVFPFASSREVTLNYVRHVHRESREEEKKATLYESWEKMTATHAPLIPSTRRLIIASVSVIFWTPLSAECLPQMSAQIAKEMEDVRWRTQAAKTPPGARECRISRLAENT